MERICWVEELIGTREKCGGGSGDFGWVVEGFCHRVTGFGTANTGVDVRFCHVLSFFEKFSAWFDFMSI